MRIHGRVGVFLWLNLSAFAASAMNLTLPLTQSERELGPLPVSLSGMAVEAVSASALQGLLGPRVDAAIWSTLKDEGQINAQGMVSLTALAEKGVDIDFDPASLNLSVAVAEDAFGQAEVNFAIDYVPFSPSESGELSWLNSVNFSHRESWSDDASGHYSSLDWLQQLNIGGASGLNLQLANYLESAGSEVTFLRGEWTAYYDNPYAPYRVSLGDVESGVSGLSSNILLGGVSIKSDYAELQPQRVIGPNNEQELVLQESADVEVVINGQVIFSSRLDAGRFNLKNIPMLNGANDITVHVTYLSGKRETFVFTQFYNSNLLNEGMVNYALSAGVPSTFADNGIEYLDTWAMTGFIEYGLTSWLTLGANGTAAKYGQLGGVIATVGTDWGNVSGRVALSDHDGARTGAVGALGFESAVMGASDSQSPNLRLSAEFADSYANTPWEEDVLPASYHRYLANYVWSISPQWDATFSGSYYRDQDHHTQRSATSMLNWTTGDVSVGAGVTYTEFSAGGLSDTYYFVTFDWRWNHKPSGINLGGSYNSNDNQTRLDVSKSANDRVGSTGFRVLAEHDDNRERQSAQVNHTANRVRLEVELERNETRRASEASYSAALRGNTAIGYVDGKWGWGRAQTGPFVVTHVHPTLSGHDAQLGINQDGDYKASASADIGGLLSLPMAYADNTFDINVPDAPVGYDWGESRHRIAPGAATGHFMMIGSDTSYTAKGVLLREGGDAVSYLQGTLSKGGVSLPFFTNQSGRFFIQGVAPGIYTLTLGGDRYRPLTVLVEAQGDRLIELGTLQVACIAEECDARL